MTDKQVTFQFLFDCDENMREIKREYIKGRQYGDKRMKTIINFITKKVYGKK